MHHPRIASFCILFFPVLNLWSIVFTILCTVLSHSAVDTAFYTKLWWLFFHVVCYFAEVLQMNDLLNREYFSHALTYCVCGTTSNCSSVLMFQYKYYNAALSLTCLAMGMFYCPVLGRLIKGTLWIWCSYT